jgi:hypothetical protein
MVQPFAQETYLKDLAMTQKDAIKTLYLFIQRTRKAGNRGGISQ